VALLWRVALFQAAEPAGAALGAPIDRRSRINGVLIIHRFLVNCLNVTNFCRRQDPSVLKVGVGASEDAGYLRTRVPHFDDRGSFVDLVPLIQARWPALRRPGTCAVRFIRA
jgi:hypothetical protein